MNFRIKTSLGNLEYQKYLKGVLPHVNEEEFKQEVFEETARIWKDSPEWRFKP